MKQHTRNVSTSPGNGFRLKAVFAAACLASTVIAASAATPVLNIEFNEGNTSSVTESIHGLVGAPPGDPPTSVTDSPSGQAGDYAIQFEAGQYIQMEDPDQKMQLDPDDPSFTLQAWVKFDGDPAARMVFFYNNGPGGAISFSVNTGRTVFVTTLGILDAGSAATIPDDGKWHHIAVVHENGVALRYYVDGELGETRDYTSGVIFTRTQTFFTLGAEPGGGLAYTGSLDRLKVTSGVLTPDQFDSRPTVGPVADSDNDGMPNDWETKYGLNPNDASDAAKDCNNNGVTNLDEFKANLDPCDATAPALVSTKATGTFDTVNLTFSEVLDPATATNAANYAISPSLAISAVSYKSKVVTLTTAKQAPGTAYTVAIKDVADPSKNKVAADTKGEFYSYMMGTQGLLKFSYWGDATGGEQIPGTPVDNLYADPRYPASPDLVGAVYSFNSRDFFPDDAHELYGATIEGFITPTESGDYRFFIYSDDASQLYLSTDATEANLALIAEETSCCNNFTEPDSPRTSEPISLTAGRKYFTRLVYKEGGGGDYGQVAWRKEGDTTAAASLRPIPGKYLSSAVELPMPSEGAYITRTPAPNATAVPPIPTITIVHSDGKTPWTADNVTLKLNGVAVTPTFSKENNVATVTYKPAALLPSKATQTITLGYTDPSGKPATEEWSFETLAFTGPTQDLVKSYDGLLLGTAKFTADAGGKSGKAGDYGIDFGTGNKGKQSVWVYDASFLNEATAKDELSIVAWQKLHSVNNSSLFWGNSPSSSGSERGFQVHTPWDTGGTLYFDTAGCCDATTQRINASIAEFADYSGDVTWWQDWHHLVVQKKGAVKEIWIDGKLFLSGESTSPLPTDFNQLYWGYCKGDDAGLTGIIDDAAIFSTALTEADIAKLAAGTLPNALGGTAKLMAYWDFNDAKAAAPPTLSAARTATGLTLTFTGTLQSATAVNGPWTDEAGTSPATLPVTGTQKFYRAKQ